MEIFLPSIEKSLGQRLGADRSALSCTLEGLFLADSPLIRRTTSGFRLRPQFEIKTLLKSAYGGAVDADALGPGLDVISAALSRGDVGRAMVAALHMRLPPLTAVAIGRIANADQALAKYSPDQPRDNRGRWTDGDASTVPSKPVPHKHRHRAVQQSHRHRAAAPHPASHAGQGARLIPAASGLPGNPALSAVVCMEASRMCQLNALAADKKRTPFFSACHKAEDVCLAMLPVTMAKPDQPIGVIFPDHTVVLIDDGAAYVTHLGGRRLPAPLGPR